MTPAFIAFYLCTLLWGGIISSFHESPKFTFLAILSLTTLTALVSLGVGSLFS